MKSIIVTIIIGTIIDKVWHPVKRAVVSVGNKSEFRPDQLAATPSMKSFSEFLMKKTDAVASVFFYNIPS
jgi:hypothetical protein